MSSPTDRSPAPKTPKKERIDRLLVDRGLVESREKARALILAGQVLVAEQRVDKPSQTFAPDAPIRIKGERPKYVGRGGLKLEAALDAFGVDPTGETWIDVGASTGGFTDCLLQRGAARVVAVDVGHNQLDYRIRTDPRVESREGVNARYLDRMDFDVRFDGASPTSRSSRSGSSSPPSRRSCATAGGSSCS